MATQVQLRRGTEAEQDLFTGAEGELTYSTDSKGLRIHDGSTMGGLMVDVVVAWQKPTEENNYTWYRKYASGWVEQGGNINLNGVISGSNKRVTFPVEMSNTKYYAIAAANANAGNYTVFIGWESTTGMSIGIIGGSSTGRTTWRVAGMAATTSGSTGGYDDGGPSRDEI